DLAEAAAQVAEMAGPFAIDIGGTGRFPTHGPARVLWIGVNDLAGDLVKLHKRLEEECLRLGFEQEERSFSPHLTLARLRNPRTTKELTQAHLEMQLPPVEILIEELRVYRSELGRDGSKYSIISAHRFRPA